VTAVLERAEQPLHAREIHAAAQIVLGGPVKRTTVKATLATNASGARPPFERTGYGLYRMA
jgi:hypothetical protein